MKFTSLQITLIVFISYHFCYCKMNIIEKPWLLLLTVHFICAKPEPKAEPEPQLLTLGTLGAIGALGLGAGALGAGALGAFNSYSRPESSGSSRPSSLTNLLLNPLGLNVETIDTLGIYFFYSKIIKMKQSSF